MESPDDLQIPDNAHVYLAADTGTYMSALFVAVTSDAHAVVCEEHPNYRYVSDQTDLLNLTNAEWALTVVARCTHYAIKPFAWADPNTQFRAELRRYGLKLRSNTNGPNQRVSVTRDFVNNGRLFLPRYLRILPYELEHAEFAKETATTSRDGRLRRHDHTLVCLEHILSRHPRGRSAKTLPKAKRLKQHFLDQIKRRRHHQPDPNLGMH